MDGTIAPNGGKRPSAAALAEALELPVPDSDNDEVFGQLIDQTKSLLKSERRARQAAETLRVAFLELTKNLDPDLLLESLLDYLCWIVPYDRASILLRENGSGISGRANRDYRDEPSPEAASLNPEEFSRAIEKAESYICRNGTRLVATLIDGEETLGAVVADNTGGQYEERHMKLAIAFAGQAMVAIRNAKLFAEREAAVRALVSSYDATIEGWSWALELRDHDTEGHTRRVRDITVKLARVMGVPEPDIINIRRGAVLHDIGKMGIPDSILLKPTGLDEHEQGVMMRHPDYAHELLEKIPFLKPALEIPYCHHEKWDGSGYPRGLSGVEIPIAARMFAVVDVYDALTYDRPYHKAWEPAAALDHIEALSGSHFDPDIVQAFLAMMQIR
ncbi:MAG: HD domain-containing protein [Spirochaetes bacterium]|nr:HD domain-containing protein [Spirochaetota bacterium]